MAFLDKAGLETLTNRLVQGDAIKVASHRGRTIENVIDNITRECTNVPTPLEYKIENRVADFRIGQGRDVDASGDVERGYSEIELQGKTWQNVLSEFNTTNVEPVTPTAYIDYTNKDFTLEANAGKWVEVRFKNCDLLKDNCTYTVILNVTNITLNQKKIRVSRRENIGVSVYIDTPTTGVYRTSFVTNRQLASDWRHGQYWISIAPDNVEGSVSFRDVVLLEGDHTQTPVEELPQYFEGIQSSFEDGIVDIDVVGKNIIDAHSNLKSGMMIDDGSILNNLSWVYTDELFEIKPLTTYVISEKLNNYKQYSFMYYDKDNNFIGRDYLNGGGRNTITTPSAVKYFRLNYSISVGGSPIERPEIQVEQTSRKTEYEPYYKKKISFNINESLRSLPNGLCDEIVGDKLIRRIGKVTFDSNSNISLRNEGDGQTTLSFNGNETRAIAKANSMYSWCDTLVRENTSTNGLEGYGIGASGEIYIEIKRSRLSTNDVSGFKNWLSENPTTVYYELVEPIITPIEPIKFETQPMGTITINSDISPTSFHTVQLNRAAQIERGITEIAELKNRVEILETMYDSHFLETAHKLELLGMDYELESEEF